MIAIRRHDAIFEITIERPLAVCHPALAKAVVDAQSDPAIVALVIVIGACNELAAPGLADTIDTIEASTKPVLAAIRSHVLGCGLELALGCHYRIADRQSWLGLPAVTSGLLPGAGGTQRLPRLVGVAHALEIIASGVSISAIRAADIGLVDRLVPPAQAIDHARNLTAPRTTGALPPAPDPAAFRRFEVDNAARIKALHAVQGAVAAITTATRMPCAQGQRHEQALVQRLATGKQAEALRHAAFAERTAATIAGLSAQVRTRVIGHVGMIGTRRPAAALRAAGITVTLAKTATAALADCDLIIAPADQDTFARLGHTARPGAILAGHGPAPAIDALARASGRAGDVLGLHTAGRLVEVLRGTATATDALAAVMELVRQIDKVAVVSGAGAIGDRMRRLWQDNAATLVLEGATPLQIDRIHTAFGMAMGPFEMADRAGLDCGDAGTLRHALWTHGRYGGNSGAGWYDYDAQKRPGPSPIVTALIEDARRTAGVAPRPMCDDEIIARTLFTVTDEGARILEQGIAQRASDIDAVWISGYGWPRHKGGPMFKASQMGLHRVAAALARYAPALSPSPLLLRCAAQGTPLDR